MTPGPRIFCIPAADAPVVAVIRRRPTDWSHVGRWSIDEGMFESDSWFHGQLFPQKCDLSPDGRWFLYSAMKQGADWPAGDIYEAVSRLPWLRALAAWGAGTTYTRGAHFVAAREGNALGDPDVGDAAPLLSRYGLALNWPVQFCVERRHGWTETEDTAPRDPSDPWDERRDVRMRKPRPGIRAGSMDYAELEAEGSFGAFRQSPHLRTPAAYTLIRFEEVIPLDVQWADWSSDGRLLVATNDGRLQVREVPFGHDNIQSEHDLTSMTPHPTAPPGWAGEW